MDRENKITPRRVLLNISSRCRLTPIYYHILLITRMMLLLYKKWWFISRLSIQFSHAPNYRVFVPLTTVERYVISQHLSHSSNYRLLSRNSTFDTTPHFSIRLSALTREDRRISQTNHHTSLYHNVRQPMW